MSAIEDISGLENLKLDEAGDLNIKKRIISSMATTVKEVSESIKRVGYQGPLLNENEFSTAIADGSKGVEFTKLVNFLTNEIRVLRSLDECVNSITSPEDSSTFIMEISSFLNELGCPYSWLTQGHVSDRFCTEQDKLLLLEYLSLETIMARIHRQQNPGKKIDLKLHESPQAADARKMLQTFGFTKPPSNITMKTLMEKLLPKVKSAVEKSGPDLLGRPILNATLTPKKWELLNNIQEELYSDFRIRREMLLKRLDCTIQSFQWSNKTKGKEDLVNQVFTGQRKQLKPEPAVDISDLLAGRDDLAVIEKTSSASVRKYTKSAINSVIIGQVPDRGGRPSEQAPPPPEMPPWQQRNTGPGSGGGFRGGRGGGQQSSFGGGAFSQSGSTFSSTGRGSSYYQTGSSFSSSGNSYGRGTTYNKGAESSFSSGGNSYGRGSTYNKGAESSFSSGGNSYGRGSTYNKGTESSFSSGGNSYERGTSYNKSGDSFNRSDSNASRGSFDSLGSYGRSDTYERRGSSDNSQQNYTTNRTEYSSVGGTGGGYSSARDSYSTKDSGYFSKDSGYSSKESGYSKSGGSYSQSGNRGSFDSAGSYGGYSQDPKRPKTFDQYQPNKTTYADQYVQESSRNQQYHPRSDNKGGGRSNYSRGGGSSSYR